MILITAVVVLGLLHPTLNTPSPGPNCAKKIGAINKRMMSGSTGIFAAPRRLPQMKQPPAFTATRLCERAPPEYRFRRQALPPSCRVVTLVGPEAARQRMNSRTRRLLGAGEPVSPPTPKGNARHHRREVDRAAAVLALPKIPRPRRTKPKLRAPPTGRPQHHRPTARHQRPRRDRGPFRATPRSGLLLDLARVGLQLRSTDPKEIRPGWRRCTNPIPVSRLTSRYCLRLPKRCSRSNGRKKAGLALPTTRTSLLLRFTRMTFLPFHPRQNSQPSLCRWKNLPSHPRVRNRPGRTQALVTVRCPR